MNAGINSADKSIKRVMLAAFCLRVFVIIAILALSDVLGTGFLSSTIQNDDVRYELGALTYARNADRLIDANALKMAFAELGDYTGYIIHNPFTSTPVWYWTVCILVYITKTSLTVRILNALLSSLSIYYVYKFTEINYGGKTAVRASKLLAFLPYPVVFSCFLYKDQLVMLQYFILLYYASLYRKNGKLKLRQMVFVIITALVLLCSRGGFSIILIGLCLVIAFFKGLHLKINPKRGIIIFFCFVAMIFMLYSLQDELVSRVQAYLFKGDLKGSGSNISFVAISGIGDIYKLPFTYLFSMIMPIGLFQPITSWAGIINHLNIGMCVIASGAAVYIFMRKKNKIVYWSCLSVYLVAIIASVGIFRHYYSLLPLTLIAYAEFREHANRTMRTVSYCLTILYAFSLVLYYLMAA